MSEAGRRERPPAADGHLRDARRASACKASSAMLLQRCHHSSFVASGVLYAGKPLAAAVASINSSTTATSAPIGRRTKGITVFLASALAGLIASTPSSWAVCHLSPHHHSPCWREELAICLWGGEEWSPLSRLQVARLLDNRSQSQQSSSVRVDASNRIRIGTAVTNSWHRNSHA